ncbi:hypothetical protein LX36DRAFT_157120 [Colletotrichum falcatum]|nr:hypothetical protein LX36DRAFT_157120 [Colletotrichum falcatum]
MYRLNPNLPTYLGGVVFTACLPAYLLTYLLRLTLPHLAHLSPSSRVPPISNLIPLFPFAIPSPSPLPPPIRLLFNPPSSHPSFLSLSGFSTPLPVFPIVSVAISFPPELSSYS